MNYQKPDLSTSKTVALESLKYQKRRQAQWSVSYHAIAPIAMFVDAFTIVLMGVLGNVAYQYLYSYDSIGGRSGRHYPSRRTCGSRCSSVRQFWKDSESLRSRRAFKSQVANSKSFVQVARCIAFFSGGRFCDESWWKFFPRLDDIVCRIGPCSIDRRACALACRSRRRLVSSPFFRPESCSDCRTGRSEGVGHS